MQIFRSPVEVLPAIKLNDDCCFQANETRRKYDEYSTFACVSHDPSALRAPPHA
jgi:hypothetical protein